MGRGRTCGVMLYASRCNADICRPPEKAAVVAHSDIDDVQAGTCKPGQNYHTLHHSAVEELISSALARHVLWLPADCQSELDTNVQIAATRALNFFS